MVDAVVCWGCDKVHRLLVDWELCLIIYGVSWGGNDDNHEGKDGNEEGQM